MSSLNRLRTFLSRLTCCFSLLGFSNELNGRERRSEVWSFRFCTEEDNSDEPGGKRERGMVFLVLLCFWMIDDEKYKQLDHKLCSFL